MKTKIYLLPLFPPTAILVGRLWWLAFFQKQNSRSSIRHITYPAYFLGGVLVIGGITLIFIPETSHYLGGMGILLNFGILIIVFAWQRAFRFLFGIVWSFTPVLLLYAIVAVVPMLDQQLTLQPVVKDLQRFDAEDETLGLWQFYFPLTTHEEKIAFFSAKIPVYCLAREKYLEDIRRELNIPIYVLATYHIQQKRFILVSQHPVQEAFLE